MSLFLLGMLVMWFFYPLLKATQTTMVVKWNELTIGNEQKAGYSVSLFPWMPLSKEDKIPIPADWMITMVEPVTKLAQMYDEDIVKHGKDNQSDSTDNDTASTDKSD